MNLYKPLVFIFSFIHFPLLMWRWRKSESDPVVHAGYDPGGLSNLEENMQKEDTYLYIEWFLNMKNFPGNR